VTGTRRRPEGPSDSESVAAAARPAGSTSTAFGPRPTVTQCRTRETTGDRPARRRRAVTVTSHRQAVSL
jgi:hypothetical protein